MTTWSTLADQVFGAVHRLCYAGLDAPTLHERAIAQLRRAVPFEGYCAHDTDPASSLPMRQYLDPPDEPKGREFLEQVAFADDVNGFDWMLRTRRRVALLSEATDGHLERSLRYREVLAPQGFGFDLRCVYALGETAWGGISALRERGRPDFTGRAAALIGRLAPHLAAGLKAAMVRAPGPSAAGATIAPPGPAVLILDQRGRVTQHTPAAEYWLRRLSDLPVGWQDGLGLPTAMWTAVAQLRRGLHPETDADRLRVPRVRARAPSGEWIDLQAALSEGRDGQLAEMVIVIEPLGPREIAWLRLVAYDLSPREQEVVDLVARGVTTRQIGRALCIAEYTVQDHLKHIFDKTGVHSRRELLQRLYLDSLVGETAPGGRLRGQPLVMSHN
jgi:DNA-binding CsgD family transcriptional regulator